MALSMAFSENHIDAWPVVSGASISATDRDDLFVSVVSGLGSILGSQFLTSGGYLLNNAVENMELSTSLMDGWYVPTLSTPIIMTQAGAVCGRRFVFGAGDVRDGIQTLLSILKNTNSTPPSPLTEPSPLPPATLIMNPLYPDTLLPLRNDSLVRALRHLVSASWAAHCS
ncbi:hypothetical protein WDU94_012508 [Cyamophila willieti]